MLGGCATALELYAGMLKPSDTRRNSKKHSDDMSRDFWFFPPGNPINSLPGISLKINRMY